MADDAHVSVTFTASSVDEQFVMWLAQLGASGFDPAMISAVTTLIALRHLQSAPSLSGTAAARVFQIGASEATAQLQWLGTQGLVEPLATGLPNEWQLTDRARDALAVCGAPVPRQGAVESWVLAQVDEGGHVTNRQVVQDTGAHAREVTKVLRYLADTRRIRKDPAGLSRGSGVRWIRVGEELLG